MRYPVGDPIWELIDQARQACTNASDAAVAKKKWEEHLAWEEAADTVNTAEWNALDSGDSRQKIADFVLYGLGRLRHSKAKEVLARLEKGLRRHQPSGG